MGGLAIKYTLIRPKFQSKTGGLLKEAMDDLQENRVESLTYSEFIDQIDEL
jgi:hypothetical protein